MWRSGKTLAVQVGQSRYEPMVLPIAVVRDEGVVPMNVEIRRIHPTDAKIRLHRWRSPSGPVSTALDGAGTAGVVASLTFQQSGYAVAHPGCRTLCHRRDQLGSRWLARGLDGQR